MTEDSDGLGRRERRKLEARARLLAATRQMLAEQGAVDLKIADIAKAADVGFGTFYNHFESKDAIVEAVLADVLATAATAIGSFALEFADPAETASFSYRRFVLFAREEPELAAVLTKLAGAEELFEESLLPYARKTLERGRETGRFDIEDLDLCLTSVAAAAFAAIKGVLAGRFGPDADAVGAEMMLRAFGLTKREARKIARGPLPALDLHVSD
ncbi:MAG TPA: helix-turn-helix domain-containing protein [Sporichthyaceae bacterium]|nr:helix-turn-helix domain-containing protein [Sporichthyaceae bacterium]